MSNYNQSSQYVAGVPQQPYNACNNYNPNTQYVPGVPQQNFTPMNNFSMSTPINNYNPGQTYPPSSAPQIGFNAPYGSTCVPVGSYDNSSSKYGSPCDSSGNYYASPNMPVGGYLPPSIPTGGYYAPPNIPTGGYNPPPSLPGSGYAPSGQIGAYGVLPNNTNVGYSVCPSAPIEGSFVTDTTHARSYTGEMAGVRTKEEVKESTVPQPTPRKTVQIGSSTNNDKSSDYQKGLDKLAALMNDDVPVTDSNLKDSRTKYDLNKS